MGESAGGFYMYKEIGKIERTNKTQSVIDGNLMDGSFAGLAQSIATDYKDKASGFVSTA